MPGVAAIEALVCRFPAHARGIRQLEAADATFRAICEDYGDALRALAYWQAADQTFHDRVEEYRRLAEELENEALAVLKQRESE